MDDCADPLLGTKHHNDSNAVEAWRGSYNAEVWIGSNIVGAWMVVQIR